MIKLLISQIVGAIAYLLLSLSYHKKHKVEILLFQIFASIFFALQYYLLDGLTGTICNILSLFAIILIYIFEIKKLSKNILIAIIIPVLILISLLTCENVFSIFPIIASVIILISFLTESENKIRIAGAVSAISWVIYAIVYKSYVAIIFETITVISAIIALIKNNNNKSKIKEK